ncbi:MAG: lipoyl synthase, partial [Thermoanaerobaculia bacterium]
RALVPGVTIEVLVPDFLGSEAALETVFHAGPEVLNHNTETVERLYRRVRPDAVYARSLGLLRRAATWTNEEKISMRVKSGVMVGLGETRDELSKTLRDLRANGVESVTVGQYLQPHARRLPIERYYTPAEFEEIRRQGEGLGFLKVESGPLVRSSYHARRAL